MFAQIIFKMANIGLREDRGLREQRGLRELSGLKLILARMMFVVHCFCAAEPMQPFFAAPARRLLISGSRTGLLISGSRTGLLISGSRTGLLISAVPKRGASCSGFSRRLFP